jgi:hypothetical protein
MKLLPNTTTSSFIIVITTTLSTTSSSSGAIFIESFGSQLIDTTTTIRHLADDHFLDDALVLLSEQMTLTGNLLALLD